MKTTFFYLLLNLFILMVPVNKLKKLKLINNILLIIFNKMDIKNDFEYIYLVWTRESKQLNEPVYKIGKTKQQGIERFKSYPNGSSLLFHIECNDCTTKENQIKELFKEKYYPATLYGSEYFIGNYYEMIMDIIKITTTDYLLNNLSSKKTYTELHKKLNEVIEPNTNDKQKILSPENTQSEIQQLIDNKEITLTANTKPEITQQLIDNKEITLIVNVKPENTKPTKKYDEDKKYSCEYCDLKYQTLCGLKKHIKSKHQNTKTKKYNCDYCDASFGYRQSKWLHEQKCKTIIQIPLVKQVKNLTAEIKELKSNSDSKISSLYNQ